MKYEKYSILPFTLSESNKLGYGGHSTIYLSNVKFDKKIKLCAIKRADKDHKRNLLNEANILSELNHGSLPKVYALCKNNGYYYMIMEHIFGSDFHEIFCSSASEYIDKHKIITDLIEVIKYLHDCNVVHFDIKLENIILEQHTNRVVLLDFGLSRIISHNIFGKENLFHRIVGSPSYIPPEMLTDRSFYGKPCDIYSLGVTISGILWDDIACEDYPDGSPVDTKIIIKTFKDSKYFEYGLLLENMLCKNPHDRYTIDGISKILQKIYNHNI